MMPGMMRDLRAVPVFSSLRRSVLGLSVLRLSVLRLSVLGLAASAIGTTGCASFVPFTEELRTQNDLHEAELRNLQFYTSNEVTLRREATSTGRQITAGHRLVLLSGKTVEEVVLEEHTPGVVSQFGEGWMTVDFGGGTKLDFAVHGAEPASDGAFALSPEGRFAEAPNPFPGQEREEPALLRPRARSFGSGSYFLALSPSGEVRLGDKLFQAVEDSLRCHLVLDADELEEEIEVRTVVRGREL
jgi:hypothetical protein